ncbi:MAG: hypothetical protein JNM36_04380 [Chitinophagales bacterium]|nr:hypothetical protein [Chitinophagales bacterium]
MAKNERLEQEIAQMLKDRFRNRVIENVPEHTANLTNAYKKFSVQQDLKPGDIVVWKQGMKNKARPAEKEPAVVVEVLKEPIYDTESGAGTPYFHEPLNIALGLIDDDGDFLVFYYDSRRLELFQITI